MEIEKKKQGERKKRNEYQTRLKNEGSKEIQGNRKGIVKENKEAGLRGEKQKQVGQKKAGKDNKEMRKEVCKKNKETGKRKKKEKSGDRKWQERTAR